MSARVKLVWQERGEPVEGAELVQGPLDSCWPGLQSEDGRAPCPEPLHHAFPGNRRVWRGPGSAVIESCVPRPAAECREFSDQLRNRHSEFCSPPLEHVGGVLVDIDADVRTNDASIADFAKREERRLLCSRRFDSCVGWPSPPPASR